MWCRDGDPQVVPAVGLRDPEDALRDALVARLFRNAGNLAVRFPTDWGIDADEAELEFDGSVITVSPIRRGPSVTDLHREFAADPADSPAEAVEL